VDREHIYQISQSQITVDRPNNDHFGKMNPASDQIKENGQIMEDDQTARNQIRLCDRVLLLKGGGEEGGNIEAKKKESGKAKAGAHDAREAHFAQQQTPPPKMGEANASLVRIEAAH